MVEFAMISLQYEKRINLINSLAAEIANFHEGKG